MAAATSALPEPWTLCVPVLMSPMAGPARLVSWTERPPGTAKPFEGKGIRGLISVLQGGIPLRWVEVMSLSFGMA